jgi:hypothetical protein
LTQLPVYRIVNYNPNGTHTCLEAAGDSGGATVETATCDVPGIRDADQLWTVEDPDSYYLQYPPGKH